MRRRERQQGTHHDRRQDLAHVSSPRERRCVFYPDWVRALSYQAEGPVDSVGRRAPRSHRSFLYCPASPSEYQPPGQSRSGTPYWPAPHVSCSRPASSVITWRNQLLNVRIFRRSRAVFRLPWHCRGARLDSPLCLDPAIAQHVCAAGPRADCRHARGSRRSHKLPSDSQYCFVPPKPV